MDREKQIKDTLKRIKELKDSTGFKEIENYLINKDEADYLLKEVYSEKKLDSTKTLLKKYVLKSNDRNNFINVVALEKGKKLYKELQLLISNFLGDNYVLIVFIENESRYRRDEDIELFNLLFKQVFTINKTGKVTVLKTEACPKVIEIGDICEKEKGRIRIGIDLINKNNLNYEGHRLIEENVLFYGYNIEENPYLVKLLEYIAPKKVLNIIPLGSNISFHDNVD